MSGRIGMRMMKKEIRRPPTTHLVATVDDLTDMLDFDSGTGTTAHRALDAHFII